MSNHNQHTLHHGHNDNKEHDDDNDNHRHHELVSKHELECIHSMNNHNINSVFHSIRNLKKLTHHDKKMCIKMSKLELLSLIQLYNNIMTNVDCILNEM